MKKTNLKKKPAVVKFKRPEPERVNKILDHFKKMYPDAKCALIFNNHLELLISVILSAQCTDVTVNKVTPALFKRYKTASDFADANPMELERLIFSCGFYRAKAANIIKAGNVLRDTFHSQVPKTIEELIQIPGVARKTANVVLGNAHGLVEGIAVDTHVRRVSQRLGLTKNNDPVKIEQDLMKLLPKEEWFLITYRLIEHGRHVCDAKKPLCPECPLRPMCPSAPFFMKKFWSAVGG
ncbi:MAG: endonuclease III [Dehalococcoidia bacterium]|nr:endonuclease III [Dehalococcoidia bacterium]